MTKFERPVNVVADQARFGETEVGITHPYRGSFVKLADNGNIELIGVEGTGIIVNAADRSVTIIADTIKFQSKAEDGLRWNKLAFNPNAYQYNEPTFVHYDEDEISNLFNGMDEFFED